MRARAIGKSVTSLMLLTALSVGCAKERTETVGQAATRAEQAASRAEDAARRAEMGAGRVETAARRAEAAAERAAQRVPHHAHKKHVIKKHVKG